MYHFIREIYAQPDGVRSTLTHAAEAIPRLVARLAHRIDSVVLVGCGDPHFMAYGAAYAFEAWAGLPATPAEGLEFCLYGARRLTPTTLLIAVSQSGKTIQAVQAARLAQQAGAFVLAVTNTPDSPVTQAADVTLHTQCGPSLSFPTKTTTTALALLFQLAIGLGQARGSLEEARATRLTQQLADTPRLMTDALALEGQMQALAKRWVDQHHFSFIGTGPGYATALQGEAKLKETSQSRAEAHQLEEFAHLHIFALKAGDPLVFIAPTDRTRVRSRDMARVAVTYEAQVAALVTTDDAAAWDGVGVEVIAGPPVDALLSPLVQVVPIQLLAYHLALLKGRNPDRPLGFDNAALQRLVYSATLPGWEDQERTSRG